MAFYIKLRSYRNVAKLTQQELADKVGINQSMIASYELGSKVPTFPVVCAIADALGIKVDDLR